MIEDREFWLEGWKNERVVWFYWGLLSLMALDVLSTWLVLGLGGLEGNGLMAGLIHMFGFWRTMGIKVVLTWFVASGLRYGWASHYHLWKAYPDDVKREREYKQMAFFCSLIIIVMSIVVLNNMLQFGWVVLVG